MISKSNISYFIETYKPDFPKGNEEDSLKQFYTWNVQSSYQYRSTLSLLLYIQSNHMIQTHHMQIIAFQCKPIYR